MAANRLAFDNALSYTYNSQVANVEINQRFKLFSFDPYRAFSWLWGVRYFSPLRRFYLDRLRPLHGRLRILNWQTNNNLIGMQLGLQWAWGWDRFQLSTEVKAGLFANVYSQHGTDSGSLTAGFQPFDVSHNGTDLAALFEFRCWPVIASARTSGSRGLPVLRRERFGARPATTRRWPVATGRLRRCGHGRIGRLVAGIGMDPLRWGFTSRALRCSTAALGCAAP